MADDSAQRSSLKDFLGSISTIKGDLSNITAPPFVLADKSTTELPRYWVTYPDLFCAPATKESPEERVLAVLKWFLASLKAQQYAGRDPSEGVKKPLNAFLGEVFIGHTGPEEDKTELISEQVSHHPPVTACYLVNEKAGVRADGYTRQEITFSGSVNIQQVGHAILHVDKFDENYLIPLPNVTVKGILTAGPYPEISDDVKIIGSNGLVAEVNFTGKKLLGMSGKKNHVEAGVYRLDDDKRKNAIYTVEGTWSETFAFNDASGQTIDSFDVNATPGASFTTAPLEQQDPWESRKAWSGVIDSLHKGNMQGVADSKDKLESAQRELRKKDATSEDNWKPVFFRKEAGDERAERLLGVVGEKLETLGTMGVWRFDAEAAKGARSGGRGFREGVTPFG